MKKTLALSLATILLLSACGTTASEKQSLPTPSPSVEQSLPAPSPSVEQSTPAPSPEQTDEPTTSIQPAATGSDTLFNPSATMEETVLVDESDVKITATGLKYTAYEVKVSLTIENNTDQELSFYSGTLGYSCNSINGYMVDDGYLNVDVPAGKKANETVEFSVDQLTMLGFTDIADIEIGFDISDSDYDDYLQTGPRQIRTSIADNYDYETDTYRQTITGGSFLGQQGITVIHDSEEVPFDQKGIRVVSQTLVSNSSGEQVLLIEVENTSDDMVYASVGDTALNGLSVESGTWSTDWVSPGKRRVMSIQLYSLLDESYQGIFGIDEISSVSYSFEISDIEYDTLVIPPTLTLTVPGGKAAYDPSGEEVYRENGIRIVSKEIVPDDSDYSDDIHLLFLVENNTQEALSFGVDYDSVSVNGYMARFLCSDRTAAPGGGAILDVELQGYSLEENGITALEDITEVELKFEIENGHYKTVAEPVVTVSVAQ